MGVSWCYSIVWNATTRHWMHASLHSEFRIYFNDGREIIERTSFGFQQNAEHHPQRHFSSTHDELNQTGEHIWTSSSVISFQDSKLNWSLQIGLPISLYLKIRSPHKNPSGLPTLTDHSSKNHSNMGNLDDFFVNLSLIWVNILQYLQITLDISSEASKKRIT